MKTVPKFIYEVWIDERDLEDEQSSFSCQEESVAFLYCKTLPSYHDIRVKKFEGEKMLGQYAYNHETKEFSWTELKMPLWLRLENRLSSKTILRLTLAVIFMWKIRDTISRPLYLTVGLLIIIYSLIFHTKETLLSITDGSLNEKMDAIMCDFTTIIFVTSILIYGFIIYWLIKF